MLCTLDLFIVNVLWFRNSDGFLTIFTFKIWWSLSFLRLITQYIHLSVIWYLTRMHSSRMRTGHALTVSGEMGGGWCIPEEILGEKNWKKRRKKKFGDPLKNWRTPPEKLETPSEKLETHPKNWRPTRDQTPPLWTDTRLWKYYLGPTSLRPVTKYHNIMCWKIILKARKEKVPQLSPRKLSRLDDQEMMLLT